MFGNSNDDLKESMKQMWHDAHNRSCANKLKAAESVKSWLEGDSRFQDFDAQKLVDRFSHCLGSGARLDLDDPALRKGGRERPCQLKGSRY